MILFVINNLCYYLYIYIKSFVYPYFQHKFMSLHPLLTINRLKQSKQRLKDIIKKIP